ncbi:Crp/Fnr family transcriptional regulator [Lolliginicoccus suaedae]|uniref:Crp/Fnr family transcriptional regulator n=1 Tax=Lolliginicoccus suaedae TaxID=2605429 RepID=UPI0011EFBC03|nr:Crp/Fnr family transcriptional regulator [Lolliginicoccus suaedae]
MGVPGLSRAPLGRAAALLGDDPHNDAGLRHAAWVARCVGRGEAAPLTVSDVTALAEHIQVRSYEFAERIFHSDSPPGGVWIVKSGRVELTVGTGPRKLVVQVLRGGDVDGDVQHFLDMNMPYDAHALEGATLLFLDSKAFDALLAERPTVARRWLLSVAQRVATSQNRIIDLLGCTLAEQVAKTLLAEAVGDVVELPQKTLAAMLGVQRQSLNRVLKKFERDGLVGIRYSAVDIRDSARLGAIARA